VFGRESLKDVIRTESEKTREFEREILFRNEKVYTAMIAQLERNTEQIRVNTEETRENIAETRAHRQVLLKLLDEKYGI
jgi:hypothetical protein